MPVWATALLLVAVMAMLAGLAIPLVAGGADAGRPAAPPGALGLAGDGAAPGAGPAEPRGVAAWSPAIFRLGFSFFVGFAVAFALRTFFAFALAAVGFFVLALFGLQYSGLVEIKWGLLEQRYDAISQAAAAEARTAAVSAMRYLPSAGAAAAGLVAGWWRRKW
jgi:uncharacterized membrane protein (Fun14 family)